ncbi:glycoside hydrolase [Calycina marina]|uniref:Glycoside hydrolase n=1 Tax=Calycina marina TaxID=1763456 RepID=A0A9P7ZBQ7_9HELO|nr:glycoside hydrolase [Calycina marina]
MSTNSIYLRLKQKLTHKSIPGSGSTTTTPPTQPATFPPTQPTTSPSNPGNPAATEKPVFFHYMIGSITDDHCRQDVVAAKALGADAFALNTNSVTGTWATDTIASLFRHAEHLGFKLFFSFDMTGFNHPNQFRHYLKSYVGRSGYFKYGSNSLPLVSTFNGGTGTFGQPSVDAGWNVELKQWMAINGAPIYFVPAFQDVPVTSSYYSTYPSLDGAMNWNSWPHNNQGQIAVQITDDQTLQNAGRSAGKTFLMGISPLQFKHMDSGNNWYRRGEANLEIRFGQVLQLQPDFIEFQTWNDTGESHYMGLSWPEPISGTTIGSYTNGYDHTGYNQILPAFIKAFKAGATNTDSMVPTNGAAAQGTFWHHTLVTAAGCSDYLGPPQGANTAEDRVTAVVLVASGQSGLKATVTSGSKTLGTANLKTGYNSFSYPGVIAGQVIVKVTNAADAIVISGTGPISVSGGGGPCNYNFQVVGLY